MLRKNYYELAMDDERRHTDTHRRQLDEQKQLHEKHIIHCFDYLRQSIMCAADSTLERMDPKTVTTDGWGTTHQCHDYDALFKWSEDHTRFNYTGLASGL